MGNGLLAVLLPYFLADVAELFDRGLLKPLALPVEMLVDLQGRLLHDGVGFLRTADEDEIVAARQTSMSVVVVEGDAQQCGRSGSGLGGFHRPELGKYD